MFYDVAFDWKRLPEKDLSRTAVVVADILRATTVMILALQHGARAILPQDSDEAARRLYARLKAEGEEVLLCGEKEGFKRAGYDLGNSPLEFTPDAVQGKTVIHLTTNGTCALRASAAAAEILIASFANVSAVSRYLYTRERELESILLVVSGREGEYCIEDTVCLGGILMGLLQPPGKDIVLSDSARTAIDLFQVYQGSLLDLLRQSYHGRYLQEVGLGDDLPACAHFNTTELVPRMVEGKVIA